MGTFFFKVFILIVDRIGGGRDSEFMFLVDILTVIWRIKRPCKALLQTFSLFLR